MSFLESKELDEYPKIFDKKVVCYKIVKVLTSLLTAFALLLLGMVLIVSMIALIQSF